MPLIQAPGHYPLGSQPAIKTLRHWVRSGRLRAWRIGGRLFIDPADIAATVIEIGPTEAAR